MKRILIISITILLSGTLLSAQTSKTDQMYRKYKGEEGVISLWIPGFVVRLASSIADLEREERALLRSIRSVRLLTIDDGARYPGVNFTREANIRNGQNGYEIMVQINDGGEDVMILGREHNGRLKDLLVLVGGEDNVMVHIKGRMNANMIGAVAEIAGKDGLNFSAQP